MIRKYYEGTSEIINLSTEIGKLLGVVDSTYLRKPETNLRKENRIKSIQSSLEIEGNTLNIDQVTTLFNNKRVLGPSKDILEVKNAIKVYNQLDQFDPYDLDSYLCAHELLMQGLIEHPGQFRTKGVGIFKGEKVAHMAPPAWNVHHLMTELFSYLSTGEDNLIIKSCVFHYEMEFIHPFMDGNGRMGRLWQTIILMKENPVFEYLPIEEEVRNTQSEYYETLSIADKQGVSTVFIEYMLGIIKKSLQQLIETQRTQLNDEERILYFIENYQQEEFSRKDYLSIFKDISTATATRDLNKGIRLGKFEKKGEDRTTKYRIVKKGN
uniref:Fic family protein n=1 Tax=Portibacter marinus TaxID=2898660 RepID=UPI001F202E77|nr:Fic family protein [Portibacter marinus]